jgi:hypothetical protein
MVPNRFTRKVTVLLVPGMAVAEGEREVARGGIEPAIDLGKN